MGRRKKLFYTMFRIGMIGFGGGNALIPVIENSAVEEEGFVSKSEYEEDIVVASITPGALPVELAGGIGKRVAGKSGMIIGASAMALPGGILTVLILSAMSKMNSNVLQQVEFLAIGISAFISCLLSDYIFKTVSECKKQEMLGSGNACIIAVFFLTCGKNLYRLLELEGTCFFGLATINIFIIAFFIIFYTNCRFNRINTIVTGILCTLYVLCEGKKQIITNEYIHIVIKIFMVGLAIWGIIKNIRNEGQKNQFEWKSVLGELIVLIIYVMIPTFAALLITEKSLQYVINGIISSLMSFGGGDAYLTVADGLFVNSNMISESEFYGTLVPIVNILPGSILCKTLSGIGYYIGYGETGNVVGGWIVAMAGFIAGIAASCGVFVFIGKIYRNFQNIRVFQGIKIWIRPIVAGLMLTVILSLIYQSSNIGKVYGEGWKPVGYMIFIYILDLFLYYKIKLKNGTIVLISAILSFSLCNLIL